jgi:hypothetical protein
MHTRMTDGTQEHQIRQRVLAATTPEYQVVPMASLQR